MHGRFAYPRPQYVSSPSAFAHPLFNLQSVPGKHLRGGRPERGLRDHRSGLLRGPGGTGAGAAHRAGGPKSGALAEHARAPGPHPGQRLRGGALGPEAGAAPGRPRPAPGDTGVQRSLGHPVDALAGSGRVPRGRRPDRVRRCGIPGAVHARALSGSRGVVQRSRGLRDRRRRALPAQHRSHRPAGREPCATAEQHPGKALHPARRDGGLARARTGDDGWGGTGGESVFVSVRCGLALVGRAGVFVLRRF